MKNLEMVHNYLPTSMPAWIVLAWPPVLWQAQSDTHLQFVHLGTRVVTAGEHGSACAGQTLWGGTSQEGAAGVAWDWVELQRGVVAMADPMAVVTNLRLVGDEGEVLSALESARHFNWIVHGLPWQHEVERALGAPGVAALAISVPLTALAPGGALIAPGSLLTQ